MPDLNGHFQGSVSEPAELCVFAPLRETDFVPRVASGLKEENVPAKAQSRKEDGAVVDRLMIGLNRFAFVSLLALIVLVAIPFGTVEPWWISVYECAVFGLGALWIIEALISGAWNFSERQFIAPIAALLAFVFIQSITLSGVLSGVGSTSADPFETRLMFFKFLALCLNGALLLRYVSTSSRLRTLIHLIVGVAVASAIFGIARQALQHTEIGFLLPYLRRDSGFGQFVNKNHFAFLMEMAIGLAIGLVFGGAVRRQHLLIFISAVALMWTGLVLTSSRGGLLSSLAQIVFLVLMLAWRKSAKCGERCLDQSEFRTRRSRFRSIAPALGLSICLLAIVAVSALWVGGDLLVTRLASLPGEIKTESAEPHAGVRRREVWGATWQLIKAHPLAGTGLGAYSVAITRFHDASGKWTPEAAHNDYLELLAAGGLIGTALVVWFAFVFLKSARQRICSADTLGRAACLGALTGIFGVMAHNLVDFGLHVTANAVVFIALMVIATRATGSGNRVAKSGQ